MKELIFVRHAKSDWGNESLKDIDRHLNERGYDSAYVLSQWFASKKNKPDLILSSTATRAVSTALIFTRAMDFNMERFKLDARIYETTWEKLLKLVQETDDAAESVMVFGHNPAITNICNELSTELYFDNIPTCGVISLRFEVNSWKQLEPKKGKLNFYEYPKNIMD
ncbi:MAG: histidine phosphatase family protein [Bacteroidia bacterium]|nr:histidine phosphatase family protein [Bacteroidia bacterium]